MYVTAMAYVEFAETYPEHFRMMFRKDLIVYNPETPPKPVLEVFTELTNVILRQRGELEILLGSNLADKSTNLIKDILIGWSYIHGYAHLRLEGQLGMVSEDAHRTIMRENAERLSNLLQQRRV
jgi:hypothetical protein